MKKQNNKITENEFNVARESFLSNSLSVEQKRSMFDNILKSSSASVSLDGAKGADENAKAGIESGSAEPIGRMHDVKGKGDNADFKTISLGKTIGVVSFIQPHMLKQKVFITLLILIVFLAGTSFASTYSLPGDLLYGVKVRVIEPMVIKTKLSTKAKIQHRIALIDRRIEELNMLQDIRPEDAGIIKHSIYITQENISALEKTAPEMLKENSIQISAKIHEYNELVALKISNSAILKASLTGVVDVFLASSTVSALINSTSTPGTTTSSTSTSGTTTNASSTTNENSTSSASISVQGTSTLRNSFFTKPIDSEINSTTSRSVQVELNSSGTVTTEPDKEVTEPVEVKPQINSWIKSDIFKVVK